MTDVEIEDFLSSVFDRHGDSWARQITEALKKHENARISMSIHVEEDEEYGKELVVDFMIGSNRHTIRKSMVV